jgi:hypothetical protein
MRYILLGWCVSGIAMAIEWSFQGNTLFVILNLISGVLGLGFYGVIRAVENKK